MACFGRSDKRAILTQSSQPRHRGGCQHERNQKNANTIVGEPKCMTSVFFTLVKYGDFNYGRAERLSKLKAEDKVAMTEYFAEQEAVRLPNPCA
jgi:hypothetical protein